MNAVGSHIRKLRRRHNMTQQALADRLNVTRQAVSQWENGNTRPDLDTLAAIAGVFGVDVTEVIYGEKKKEASGLDQARRKRYLKWLIVFGGLSLVMLGLNLFLRPYLSHLFRAEYRLDFIYYRYFAETLLYLLIPVAMLCGGSMIRDIGIRRRGVRRAIFAAAALWVLFHYSAGLVYWRDGAPLEPGIIYRYLVFALESPAIFLLPGVLLFLGLNGWRTGENAKQIE
ncbi:MAG: helix-turn-helix transcriptional regulator [Christensenellaceae bacterium]|nr:helix-turn-helix transcriptional regulator [Christensenellaceae bacterium]